MARQEDIDKYCHMHDARVQREREARDRMMAQIGRAWPVYGEPANIGRRSGCPWCGEPFDESWLVAAWGASCPRCGFNAHFQALEWRR